MTEEKKKIVIKKAKPAAEKKPRAVKKSKPAPDAAVETVASPEAALAAPVAAAPETHPAAPVVIARPKPKAERKVVRPATEAFQGTGRRKRAIARVYLKRGTGLFKINGRPLEDFTHGRVILDVMARRALEVTKTASSYDVFAKLSGGGVSSQVGALSQGIARSLLEVNPDFRKALKHEGLLTRDPREKERKKYGRKRARKRFQYSKR